MCLKRKVVTTYNISRISRYAYRFYTRRLSFSWIRYGIWLICVLSVHQSLVGKHFEHNESHDSKLEGENKKNVIHVVCEQLQADFKTVTFK